MPVPVIFKDVNPDVYTITEDCHIYRDGALIPMDDIIYNSTNGYDYVLLEKSHMKDEDPTYKLYRLEFIMVSSFNPGLQNKWQWFKVNHIDGDIKNCHIDNLTWEEDVEEWDIMQYPTWIPYGKYAISSWGRAKNIKTGRILVCPNNDKGYPRMNFYVDNKLRERSVHQLVASHFVYNEHPDRFTQINHIDGDTTNNHYTNLEWCDNKINSDHAYTIGLNIRRSTLSTEEVDLIVDLLIKHKGHIQDVYDDIDHDKHPSIKYNSISNIKYNKCFKTNPKSRYYMMNITFPNVRDVSNLSSDDVDMIIEMLLDPIYKGSVKYVYDNIDHTKYPHITRGIINLIKCRNPIYCRNDSKYDLRSIKFPASTYNSRLDAKETTFIMHNDQ